jgi:hypothetical protein
MHAFIGMLLVLLFRPGASTSFDDRGRGGGASETDGRSAPNTPGRLFSLAGRRPKPQGATTAEVAASGSYNAGSSSASANAANAAAGLMTGQAGPIAPEAVGPQGMEQGANIFALNENASKKAPSSERYIVLSLRRLGLANRLRSLADWVAIASMTNR